MTENAEYLKSLASHFAPRDWNYTRDVEIKHIRYYSDTEGRNTLRCRIQNTISGLLRKDRKGSFLYQNKFLDRLLVRYYTARHTFRKEDNRPDGTLDGGSVITHWEETGEYLQMVQPSVGILLSEFLLAEPEHPHAKIIIAELDRIQAGYVSRIDSGEVIPKRVKQKHNPRPKPKRVKTR